MRQIKNKRIVILSLPLIFCLVSGRGQDIFTRGLVYQVPGMKKVIVKEKLVYRNVNDTVLSFDIYYPPAFNFKKELPLVIFNNGVGAMEIPKWGIYKDWAKLIAANGMIGLNYQSRGGNALQDGEVLLDYLVQHAKKLNIDAGKVGLWTCSANARTGMRLAFKTRPALIKSLVVYYGGPDSLGQLRQDLPTLIVRPGLDAQFVNARIENFIQNALQQDAQFELVNYVNGIHAFDAFQNTDEAKKIIVKTIEFLKKNLTTPYSNHDFVLTNKNFMWLIMNNQLSTALSEFRKARAAYRADSSFQPFFNAVIREDVLNANGYWLLQNQRQQEALEVFKLAAESYTESPNAYESLSEAFETTGNKEEALRNAELCLQKLPSANDMDENFRKIVKQSAEGRIKRLSNKNVGQTLPPKRAHHELVYDEASNRIIMTAGSTPLNGGSSFDVFNDIWNFDGKVWSLSGTAGDKRSGIKMAYDTKRNKLFSFGGWSNGNSLAELRVLENGDWKVLSNLPEMKASEPGFVYDEARDRLIAFGGSAARGVVNSITWEWDGTSWKKFEGSGPEGRQAFAMIYDSRRKKTVLYGGMGTSLEKTFGDTWEFDGSRWTKVSETGPGQRRSPGYAYDSKRAMMIIFGGSMDGLVKDTWGWDGKEWKKIADSGPPARAMGYMAYDKQRDRVVMFGGRLGWPNDANDTWEWDGNEWKEIK
jgi:tetratricopeptide (TPR) repeat protein